MARYSVLATIKQPDGPFGNPVMGPEILFEALNSPEPDVRSCSERSDLN